MISILRQRVKKHVLQATLKIRLLLGVIPDREIYYFGYGANLSVDRFLKRKMNVEEICNGNLEDHELRFTLRCEYLGKGYAGVHPKSGHQVWGVLYKIDHLSLRLLDTLEWCGFGAYIRKEVDVKTPDGEYVSAWCYFVKQPVDGLIPSKQYKNNLIFAANLRKFPQKYLDFLAQTKTDDRFPIDHSFSLLFYGKKRFFVKQLYLFYKIHDTLREKLCDLI